VVVWTGVLFAILGKYIFIDSHGKDEINCDTVILGGGIAGLYSSYRLNGTDTCVFESSDYLGGRIKDEEIDYEGNTRYVGVGGLRVDDEHHVVKYLAYELGIELDWRAYMAQRVNTRGLWTEFADDTLPAYPTVNQTWTLATMYDYFFAQASDPDGDLIRVATTMESFLGDLFAPEGHKFLVDNTRFRSDFTATDIRSYIQFLQLDIAESSDIEGYPVHGMSSFARGMYEGARDSGVRFFLNEKVQSVDGHTGKYRIETANRIVHSKRVVVALDPTGLRGIGGNIGHSLRNLEPVHDVKPMPVTIVGQRFASRWWDYAFGQGVDGLNKSDVRRIWTTDKCINYVEIAMTENQTTAEKDNFHTARTVYADGSECNEYWRSLYQGDNTLNLLHKDIKSSLRYVFRLQDDADLSLYQDEAHENNTFYQPWPNAWHFQHPNATLDLYEVEEWAKRPLGADEDVVLANEAWSPYRTWIRGSIHSAIHAINEISDLNITIPADSPPSWPARGDIGKPIPYFGEDGGRMLKDNMIEKPGRALVRDIHDYIVRGGRH
jgi:hypothetical protein